jgi:hypothetical protein
MDGKVDDIVASCIIPPLPVDLTTDTLSIPTNKVFCSCMHEVRVEAHELLTIYKDIFLWIQLNVPALEDVCYLNRSIIVACI